MRNFAIIWAGQLVSIVGSGMVSFALGVWIFMETGQATPFGITVFLGALPKVLFAPAAGVLADRFSRKKIMIIADSFTALVSIGVMFIIFLSELKLTHIYFLSFAGALGSAFQNPAYTASIPMLVKKQYLDRANGLNQSLQAFSNLLPPLIGGFLFGVMGLKGILIIDFITFTAAIFCLIFIHVPMPERMENEEDLQESDNTEIIKKESILRKMSFGFRYLLKFPGLVAMLIMFSLINFLLNFSAVVLVPFVLTFADSKILGLVQMIGGSGMLLGGIIVFITGIPKKKMNVILGGVFILAMGIALTGAFNSPYTAAGGMFILMLIIPFASSSSAVLWQKKIPLAYQGRVTSTRMAFSQFLMPFAYLIAGPLADNVFEPLFSTPGRGMGLMFLISAVFLIITGIFAFLYKPLRNVETGIPDVI